MSTAKRCSACHQHKPSGEFYADRLEWWLRELDRALADEVSRG